MAPPELSPCFVQVNKLMRKLKPTQPATLFSPWLSLSCSWCLHVAARRRVWRLCPPHSRTWVLWLQAMVNELSAGTGPLCRPLVTNTELSFSYSSGNGSTSALALHQALNALTETPAPSPCFSEQMPPGLGPERWRERAETEQRGQHSAHRPGILENDSRKAVCSRVLPSPLKYDQNDHSVHHSSNRLGRKRTLTFHFTYCHCQPPFTGLTMLKLDPTGLYQSLNSLSCFSVLIYLYK